MTELPVFERTFEMVDLIAYAGATWDWHPLHYDPSYLKSVGLERPVVDGQMFGALLAKQILDGFGPRAFITSMKIRFTAMVFAGDTVRVTGVVTSESGPVASVAQQIHAGERLAVEASAEVRVPASDGT
ncbi:MAG: MaoC family dehydratase [Actinomycetota bacterium]|nr:MaoC family dehydratase [Actinomycetota bacterium]